MFRIAAVPVLVRIALGSREHNAKRSSWTGHPQADFPGEKYTRDGDCIEGESLRRRAPRYTQKNSVEKHAWHLTLAHLSGQLRLAEHNTHGLAFLQVDPWLQRRTTGKLHMQVFVSSYLRIDSAPNRTNIDANNFLKHPTAFAHPTRVPSGS